MNTSTAQHGMRFARDKISLFCILNLVVAAFFAGISWKTTTTHDMHASTRQRHYGSATTATHAANTQQTTYTDDDKDKTDSAGIVQEYCVAVLGSTGVKPTYTKPLPHIPNGHSQASNKDRAPRQSKHGTKYFSPSKDIRRRPAFAGGESDTTARGRKVNKTPSMTPIG
jgi:hypothetical protein